MPLTEEQRRERQRLRIALGNRGEAFALAKLKEMGFDARPTPLNTQEVDIEVFDASGRKKLFDVQVKSRDKYINWTMSREHEEWYRDDLFYCFIAFNPTAPYGGECWILPSRIVAQVLRESHQAYLQQNGKDGKPRKDGNKRNFRGNYTNRGLGHRYGPQWLDPYCENWDAIRAMLKS